MNSICQLEYLKKIYIIIFATVFLLPCSRKYIIPYLLVGARQLRLGLF